VVLNEKGVTFEVTGLVREVTFARAECGIGVGAKV
jgi:hypothetical protein